MRSDRLLLQDILESIDDIAGMRHALVHNYFEVDWSEVYVTARRDVPALRPQIEDIVLNLPPEQP